MLALQAEVVSPHQPIAESFKVYQDAFRSTKQIPLGPNTTHCGPHSFRPHTTDFLWFT